MNDKGLLTGWTALLVVAGFGLVVAGGALAPDGKLYVWLLIGAWCLTLTAFSNVYRKVRDKVTERAIRDDERRRLSGLPAQDKSP